MLRHATNPLCIPTGTVYISGPITKIPGLNKEAFKSAQSRLNTAGIPSLNPHDFFVGIDTLNTPHRELMDVCISWMSKCATIITLPGWEDSVGAQEEVAIARLMKKEVVFAEKYFKDLESM